MAVPSELILATTAPDQPAFVAAIDNGPAVQWLDWLVRLGLWAVAVIVFARQLGGELSDNEVLLPLLLFAALMAAYLLASIAPVARQLYRWAESESLSMAFAPLVLLAPYVLYGRLTGVMEVSDLLVAAVLLFMPAALALINTPRLRGADVSLGLVTVAMPLVLPLTRNASYDTTGALLRLGAFLLPVLLLLFTSREQRQRLNFLFLCAVLSLWYAVEFSAFPEFALPGQDPGTSYFQLVSLVAFLYILATTGRFGALGLSLKPSPYGLSTVATNLALFAIIAVPLGLLARFIVPGFIQLPLIDVAGRAFTIYLFIALPEEILFRGTLFRYFSDTLHWSPALVVGLSALVFGAAHLNNPPNVGWYFALAVIAGVFYARTYVATRNVGAAAALHTAVDWLWSTVFAG